LSQSKCPYCSNDFDGKPDFCPRCGWFLQQAQPVNPPEVEQEISEARIFLAQSSYEKFRIVKSRTTLGREMGDIVIAEDLELSRLHCEFIYKDHKLHVKDLESHNGVFLNERRIPPNEEIPLHANDKLKIGSNIFTVEFKSDTGTGEEIGGLSYYLKSTSDSSEYQLRLGENLIGRSEYAHIRIENHQYVARDHAIIQIGEVQGQLGLIEIQIEDKGSVNGTTVNGVQIPPFKWQKIKEGDEIAFADTSFKLMAKLREK
jgi:pSer/pThr/pTyr-binding forkhead associated (FHA) protein